MHLAYPLCQIVSDLLITLFGTITSGLLTSITVVSEGFPLIVIGGTGLWDG